MVKGSLYKAHPKLEGIIGKLEDKMARYILLMYDQKSPLRDHYPDLQKRKQFAASIAGFDLDKDDVTELFDFKKKVEEEYVPNDEMLDATIAYLKYQSNWTWSMIVSNEQAFYEFNKRVMMPVDGNKDKDILQAINIKTQIMNSQDEIAGRLKRYFRELSGEDQSLEDAIVKKKRLTAESVAVR